MKGDEKKLEGTTIVVPSSFFPSSFTQIFLSVSSVCFDTCLNILSLATTNLAGKLAVNLFLLPDNYPSNLLSSSWEHTQRWERFILSLR